MGKPKLAARLPARLPALRSLQPCALFDLVERSERCAVKARAHAIAAPDRHSQSQGREPSSSRRRGTISMRVQICDAVDESPRPPLPPTLHHTARATKEPRNLPTRLMRTCDREFPAMPSAAGSSPVPVSANHGEGPGRARRTRPSAGSKSAVQYYHDRETEGRCVLECRHRGKRFGGLLAGSKASDNGRQCNKVLRFDRNMGGHP